MNPSPSPGLSVVMPVYNEGTRLAANVAQTLGALRMLGPFEIILVNDGSTDNSGDEITRLAQTHPGEVIPLQLLRSGKGEALRRGAQESRATSSSSSIPISTCPRNKFFSSSPSSA